MSEQKKGPMTTRRKLSVLCILVAHTITVMVGTRMIWPSDNQQDHFVCPPRPRYKTEFAISSYYEGVGSINFDATEDIAADTEEFGWLYHERSGGYTLYVNSRYDFQEVLDYLKSWGECNEMYDVLIGSVPVTRGIIIGNICYIDGQEVPCTDWDDYVESIPTPTPTPTPAPEIEFPYLLELEIEPYEELWSRYTFLPPSADAVLVIDWPHTIHITDVFSQTMVFQGPATVLFSDMDSAPPSTPTPTPDGG